MLAVPALVLGGMAGPAAGWGLWAGAYPFAMYASLNSGMIDQPMFWLTASFSGLGVCALLLREAAREFTATRAVVPPPHPVTLRPDARWWTPWWYRLAARLGNVLPTIDSDPLAWRDVGRGGRTVNLGFLAIGPFTGCLVLPIVWMLTIGGVGLLATLIQNHSLAPIVAGACHVALAALVMINAATCLGRERATGAMPLLLVTPLSSASILRSKMRAAMLLWRPLVMLAVVLVTVLSVFRRGDAGTEYGDLIVPAVSLVLGTGLTAWIGLGIGARASHPAAAIPSSILVLLGWLALPLVLAPIAENFLPADLVGLIRWCDGNVRGGGDTVGAGWRGLLAFARGERGQRDSKHRSATGRRLHADGAAVGPNDLGGDRQAEAGALARRLGGVERVEDRLPDALWNPGAIVFNRQHDAVCPIRSERQADRAVAALGGDGLLGVDHEIQQNLLQLIGLAPDPAPERKAIVRIEMG